MNEEPQGMTLRDYLGVLKRWWWLILIVVVGATLAAYFNASRQTPQYAATASMIYQKPLDVSNPLSSGANYVDPDRAAARRPECQHGDHQRADRRTR